MPKPSFQKNGWRDKHVHTFLKDIWMKVDVRVQLRFEHAYYVVEAQFVISLHQRDLPWKQLEYDVMNIKYLHKI